MTVSELMPALHDLERGDKLRVMQFLLTDLAHEEDVLLTAGDAYPLWSQYDVYEAAETLQAALENDREAHKAHA